MQNLMTIDRKFVKFVFDLKGSKVGRKTKNLERVDNMHALKDDDFILLKKPYPNVYSIYNLSLLTSMNINRTSYKRLFKEISQCFETWG